MTGTLNKLTVCGFKSIRELKDFELGPLNIVIGANGAGKSNLIQLFRMLGAMAQQQLSTFVQERGGADSFCFNGPKETPVITAEFEFMSNCSSATGSNYFGNHLRQPQNTFVTTFIDYYGTSDWPGIQEAKAEAKNPLDIATIINEKTKAAVCERFEKLRADSRFIPYISVHEFEALLFSQNNILADHLKVEVSAIDDILRDCGEPEAINNSNETAPSKRLQRLTKNGDYKKTTTGIAIARQIGIDAMREAYPIFNNWVLSIKA